MDLYGNVIQLHSNSLPAGQFLMLLLSADFFSKSLFSKSSFRNTISMSNGLDPDQDRPDLGQNCRQMLSAKNVAISKERFNHACKYIEIMLSHSPAHMSHAGISRLARGLIFCLSLHLYPCFVNMSNKGSGKSEPKPLMLDDGTLHKLCVLDHIWYNFSSCMAKYISCNILCMDESSKFPKS